MERKRQIQPSICFAQTDSGVCSIFSHPLQRQKANIHFSNHRSTWIQGMDTVHMDTVACTSNSMTMPCFTNKQLTSFQASTN